jgi:hypothetical protein
MEDEGYEGCGIGVINNNMYKGVMVSGFWVVSPFVSWLYEKMYEDCTIKGI